MNVDVFSTSVEKKTEMANSGNLFVSKIDK